MNPSSEQFGKAFGGKAGSSEEAETSGKNEGSKSHAELRPEVVALAKKLRRRSPKRGQRSLRRICRAGRRGCVNDNGGPFNPASVAAMLLS